MPTKAERTEAIERLREIVKPGDTLITVLRHVSASGMMRSIDVYLFTGNKRGQRPERFWLSRLAATALGWGFDEHREAVKVSGVGMDMGFHLVYSLSATLFRNVAWRCIGRGCPHNSHNNPPYPKPDGRRKHNTGDGGYTLRQEWL